MPFDGNIIDHLLPPLPPSWLIWLIIGLSAVVAVGCLGIVVWANRYL